MFLISDKNMFIMFFIFKSMFLQLWFRLNFFCVRYVLCFLKFGQFVGCFVFLCIVWFLFGGQYQRNRLPGKTRARNDLCRVGR